MSEKELREKIGMLMFKRWVERTHDPESIEEFCVEADSILSLLREEGVDLEGWRPIEEAPKNGPDFVATDGKDIRRAWRSAPSSNSDRIVTFNQWNFSKATHWKPLPVFPAPPLPKAPPHE